MNLTFSLFVYLLGIVWKQQRHRSKSANISLVHLTLPPSTEPERLNPLEVKLDLVPFFSQRQRQRRQTGHLVNPCTRILIGSNVCYGLRAGF